VSFKCGIDCVIPGVAKTLMKTIALITLLAATAHGQTALTIYNQNFAVIRETLPLDLKAGNNTFSPKHEGTATAPGLMIEAASVQWVSGQTFGLAFFRISQAEQQRLDEVITNLNSE